MSKLPVHKPIDWRHASLNLAVLALFCCVGFWIQGSNGILVSSAIFLAMAVTLRSVLAVHHRRGIVHCRNGHFQDAIGEFQQSLAFFQRYPWIDRFRGITMLSSGHSYIEMALISLGFSYIQLNQPEQARGYYDTCLTSFPNSHMAIAGLHYLDSTDNNSIEKEIHG
jgi:tetratricopeptide (TPR) repeat protein